MDSFRSKGSDIIQTAGRWPRKLESAKKCVTTYQPNYIAPKMDGAQIHHLYSTDEEDTSLRRVGVRVDSVEGRL